MKDDGEIALNKKCKNTSPWPHPCSGPCICLPGKRENRENLLRERRRGGGDATEGERGGVIAEGWGNGERERERNELVYLVLIFSAENASSAVGSSSVGPNCKWSPWCLSQVKSRKEPMHEYDECMALLAWLRVSVASCRIQR